MARILDAQRLAEGKPLAPVSAAEPSKNGAGPEGESFSYIEVGGSAIGVQASADVLASPAASARNGRVALAQPEQTIPVLSEAGPVFVAFQPWPMAPAAPFPDLISFHRPEHPASGHYRSLLAQILGGESETQPQALLFTGVASGAGTTTALLNLAVCAAQDGNRRVVVLDLNVNRPAVAKRLGVSSGPWIDEVLAGRGGLEKALQPTRVSGLYVLAPAARGEKAVAPSTEAVRWILSWLRQRFDLILMDGQPWEAGESFAGSDAVFLVAPDDGPCLPRLSHVSQEIARQGGHLRGILKTGIQPQ